MDQKAAPTAAEQKLIAAVAAGKEADYSAADSAYNNPTQGDTWGEERTIRAELIVELCSGSQPAAVKTTVKLRSAKVTGSLDLTGKAVQCPLSLIGCWFGDQILLDDSKTKTISLRGSDIRGIRADRVSVEGTFYLNDVSLRSGEIRMYDAKIQASLGADGGKFSNPGGTLFAMDRISIGGGIFFRDGFSAEGMIILTDSHISGCIDFGGARLSNPNNVTLVAERAFVGGSILLNRKFYSLG